MQFIIITGMSGAGKSRAMAVLEDLGFYCVDNMPLELLPKFVELCLAATEQYDKVALVADVRAGSNFNLLLDSLDAVAGMGCRSQILFLDATDQSLINRYKETRRMHPLMGEKYSSFQAALTAERELLSGIRARADWVIDTSSLSTGRLRERIIHLLSGEQKNSLSISIFSFGFKYGVPSEADLVFDVRFLPNPYYEQSLRDHTGLEEPVQEYVYSNGVAAQFMDKLTALIDFLIPHYIEEGKSSLVIAVGCTGGKHRSVTIAEKLAQHLCQQEYAAMVTHRDIQRG